MWQYQARIGEAALDIPGDIDIPGDRIGWGCYTEECGCDQPLLSQNLQSRHLRPQTPLPGPKAHWGLGRV
jgi:hypothetical protein